MVATIIKRCISKVKDLAGGVVDTTIFRCLYYLLFFAILFSLLLLLLLLIHV